MHTAWLDRLARPLVYGAELQFVQSLGCPRVMSYDTAIHHIPNDMFSELSTKYGFSHSV